MNLLETSAIECRYNGAPVLFDLSLRVRAGGIVGLLGPSGCGKTTALRAIAGFEPVHRGEILLAGRSVSRPGYTLVPEKRRLGMVFQDYSLFPHVDVRANLAFGLRRLPRRAQREITRRMLEVMGLSGFGRRYPHELSGGQQQRVALARALAPKPDMLLMDEAFSSLDADLRDRLSLEVRDILKDQGITAVLVTHDHHEAFAICEKVGVMREGRIVQWDTPYNLYHEPVDRFVATFVGQGRFLDGALITPDSVETALGVIKGNRAYPWPKDTRVEILLRPDDVVPDPHSTLIAEVKDKAFKGAETLYTLRLPTGGAVLSLIPSHRDYALGDRIPVRIAPAHLVAFSH